MRLFLCVSLALVVQVELKKHICYKGSMFEEGGKLDRSGLEKEECGGWQEWCSMSAQLTEDRLNYKFACATRKECSNETCNVYKEKVTCCCNEALCNGKDKLFQEVFTRLKLITSTSATQTTERTTTTPRTSTTSKTSKRTTSTTSTKMTKTSKPTTTSLFPTTESTTASTSHETTTRTKLKTHTTTPQPQSTTEKCAVQAWHLILVIVLLGTVASVLTAVLVWLWCRRKKDSGLTGRTHVEVKSTKSKLSEQPESAPPQEAPNEQNENVDSKTPLVVAASQQGPDEDKYDNIASFVPSNIRKAQQPPQDDLYDNIT